MNSFPSHWGRCVGFVIALLLVSSVGLAQEARVAVPSAARQAEIRKVLDDTFGLSKATNAARKQEVIKALMDVAADKATPKDDLYVVLQTALPLIKDVNDFPQLQSAIAQLTETFDVNANAERTKHVSEFLTACKTQSALEPALTDILTMVGDATRENRFDAARQLLAAADKTAKRVMAKNVPKSLTEARKAIQERENGFKSQSDARKTLTTTPDDPKANLAVGQWLAIHEENWAQALPYLAKGSDAKWKAAASAELKDPKEAESQLAVADAWWDVAQASTGAAKVAALHYASNWYDSVEPNVKSPLIKAKVAQRQKELAASLQASESGFGARSSSTTKPRPQQGDDELPIGKSIDLLEMVKLPDHAVFGNWKRLDNGIGCESFPDVRFMAPVVVTGSYQLMCKFTRRMGKECVAVIFPVGETYCTFMLGGWGGTISGLDLVDKRVVGDLVGTPAAVRQKGPFTNGVAHELQVTVSQQGQNVAIQASVDGDRFISWKGSVAQLSNWGGHALPNPHAIGVLAHSSIVDVHELKLELKRGSRGYRLGDDWKNPLFVVADKPTPDVAKRCLTWNGQKYFISDKPLSLPDAQLLATQLKGRLLTISSADEEKFIFEQGRGLSLWMAGWCPPDRKWRDERNRPLRYFGKWGLIAGRVQPDNIRGVETQLEIWTKEGIGWNDIGMGAVIHACIEWGEEYPEDLETNAK